MTPSGPLVRLVAFAVALLVTFGAGLALGAAAGPFGDDPPRVPAPAQESPSPGHGDHR